MVRLHLADLDFPRWSLRTSIFAVGCQTATKGALLEFPWCEMENAVSRTAGGHIALVITLRTD